mmetsp:Transcript_7147/g.23430  ORF Transcript_7147/g.23430 Transcript_7147/m.23430 type:complete len:346 (-) Transcript_7147:32-1069(-)
MTAPHARPLRQLLPRGELGRRAGSFVLAVLVDHPRHLRLRVGLSLAGDRAAQLGRLLRQPRSREGRAAARLEHLLKGAQLDGLELAVGDDGHRVGQRRLPKVELQLLAALAAGKAVRLAALRDAGDECGAIELRAVVLDADPHQASLRHRLEEGLDLPHLESRARKPHRLQRAVGVAAKARRLAAALASRSTPGARSSALRRVGLDSPLASPLGSRAPPLCRRRSALPRAAAAGRRLLLALALLLKIRKLFAAALELPLLIVRAAPFLLHSLLAPLRLGHAALGSEGSHARDAIGRRRAAAPPRSSGARTALRAAPPRVPLWLIAPVVARALRHPHGVRQRCGAA